MEKKKKQISLKTWLTPKLRRLSYQWPYRAEAKKQARKERGLYECAECKRQGLNKLWKRNEVHMDHINPVVSLAGFASWDDHLNRLFCNPEQYQALCATHHELKTELENNIRNINKKKKKNLTKKKQ